MYTRILVPVDGSATSQQAQDHAARLAQLSGASMILLHILDELTHSNGFERPETYIQDIRPRFLAAGQLLLDATATDLRHKGLEVQTVLVESHGARVSELIARQAEASGCDLIVLGTHGRRGFNRLMLGSDAEQVARTAPVPVMLVRSHPAPEASHDTGRAGFGD